MTGKLPRDRVGIKLTRGSSILQPGGGIRAAALPRPGPAANRASRLPAAVCVAGRAFSSCELNRRHHEQRNLNPSPTEQHPSGLHPRGPEAHAAAVRGILPKRATLNGVRAPAYAFTRLPCMAAALTPRRPKCKVR